MRFLSKFGHLSVLVQVEESEALANGRVRITQPGIYVQFAPGSMRPLERELAIAHWGPPNSWNGFYQERDEVTIVPPDYRIGVYDSEDAAAVNGWDLSTREQVEQSLIANAKYTNNVLVIPRTVVPAPWPRYDEFAGTTDELVMRLVEDGHDLAEVLEYEKNSLKREDVIAALTALVNDPDALLELQPDEEELVG